jgi:hypothetical protein
MGVLTSGERTASAESDTPQRYRIAWLALMRTPAGWVGSVVVVRIGEQDLQQQVVGSKTDWQLAKNVLNYKSIAEKVSANELTNIINKLGALKAKVDPSNVGQKADIQATLEACIATYKRLPKRPNSGPLNSTSDHGEE